MGISLRSPSLGNLIRVAQLVGTAHAYVSSINLLFRSTAKGHHLWVTKKVTIHGESEAKFNFYMCVITTLNFQYLDHKVTIYGEYVRLPSMGNTVFQMCLFQLEK